jgi:hypothetical protein
VYSGLFIQIAVLFVEPWTGRNFVVVASFARSSHRPPALDRTDVQPISDSHAVTHSSIDSAPGGSRLLPLQPMSGTR